jgi:non-heme chloroperoxidase
MKYSVKDLKDYAIGATALLSSGIVKGSTLKIYPGAPHGLCSTHKDQVNADLLAFLKA